LSRQFPENLAGGTALHPGNMPGKSPSAVVFYLDEVRDKLYI